MGRKRVVQAYKAPDQWINSPPGLGDFVRGACHLFEKLQGSGIELRIDMSQTGFAALITQDSAVFQSGDPSRIAAAEEYFVDHVALHSRLVAFLHSDETELYVCTNLGAWNRTTLPVAVREFITGVYRFSQEVEAMNAQALQTDAFEVLSIRCGDSFYGNAEGSLQQSAVPIIFKLIEQTILPRVQSPLVVTSDCHPFKLELAKRYGMRMLPHRSQHGAFGHALPVAMDMCMLKNSRFNYHINSWATWWSGFSHYTSVIFQIPSMNFRAPQFTKEEISAQGELVSP